MPKPTENLRQLSDEVKLISLDIAELKDKFNDMDDGPEKLQLEKDIKTLQYQALFYIEKIENLSRAEQEEEL